MPRLMSRLRFSHLRFPYKGAGIGLVLNGSILLGKRTKKLFYGKWAVPGGGKEKGESYLACAKGEFFEETGCNLDSLNAKAIGSWTLSLLPFFKWTTFFYQIDLFTSQLKPDEFSALEWVPIEKVKARRCRPFTNCEIKKLSHLLSI